MNLSLPEKFFITGTDTEVGKTHVSVSLLNYFTHQGLSTLGIKPLASGANWHQGRLRNTDALALQKASSVQLPYERINPCIFEPAIAPHIAAQKNKITLSAHQLMQQCHFALTYPVDICVIEGAGGWHIPLNDQETMADFVKQINCSVILVVGIRLGCLNHAILTHQAIQKSKVNLLGWIANCIDPHMLVTKENILTLKKWLTTPLLATVAYNQSMIFKNSGIARRK